MSDQPDTIDAVADAIWAYTPFRKPTQASARIQAEGAIAAHVGALVEQGYAVVKVGSIPEWLEELGYCNRHGVGRCEDGPFESLDPPLYRLSPVSGDRD